MEPIQKAEPGEESVIASTTCASTKQSSPDAQEFETFYREHLGLIYRYVYRKVGNREEAQDLTSSIFLKAVRGIQQE